MQVAIDECFEVFFPASDRASEADTWDLPGAHQAVGEGETDSEAISDVFTSQ
jgi:hypothetical protein